MAEGCGPTTAGLIKQPLLAAGGASQQIRCPDQKDNEKTNNHSEMITLYQCALEDHILWRGSKKNYR
jgi:hypothetical protein